MAGQIDGSTISPYSFYFVGKIIQMNSSQPGQLIEYWARNTVFEIQSSFSNGCRQTDMWYREEGLDKSSDPFIICQEHSDVNFAVGRNKNWSEVLKK